MSFPVYTPNEDEAAVSGFMAKRRTSLSNRLAPWERTTPREREAQQYAACLAEISVCRISNLCWTGLGKGSDGLIDVGNRYEVRSITDPRHGLLVRSKDFDKPPLPFVLVHVDTETRTCRLLGWRFPSAVRRLGRTLDSECWRLSQDLLFGWPPR